MVILLGTPLPDSVRFHKTQKYPPKKVKYCKGILSRQETRRDKK